MEEHRFNRCLSDGHPPSCALMCYSKQDLYAFLQTLYAPWGFGSEHIASKREMRNKVRRLHLQIFEGNRVHFKVRLGPLCFSYRCVLLLFLLSLLCPSSLFAAC